MGGRDPRGLHDVLREGLRPLDLRGLGTRTEGRDAGRAQGVGAAVKAAVVAASVLILASNYLLTEAFFGS